MSGWQTVDAELPQTMGHEAAGVVDELAGGREHVITVADFGGAQEYGVTSNTPMASPPDVPAPVLPPARENGRESRRFGYGRCHCWLALPEQSQICSWVPEPP